MTTFSSPSGGASTLDEAAALTTPGERLRELVALSPEHGRAVAGNPAAPAALLRELASSWGLGEVLARNPALPPDVLWTLAARYPREVIANPALPLAMLVQPDVGAIPSYSLQSLLRSGFLPDEWFRWCCDHAVAVGLGGHWLLLVMARLPHTPADVFERLGAMQPFVYETLLQNPSLPRSVASRLAASPDPKVQVLVAQSAHAPADWLTWKSRSRSTLVRVAVAGNARTPGRALGRLASDRAPEVRSAVARNWFTPRDALRHLEGVAVAILASNPSLPAARGRELLRDGVRASQMTVRQGDLLVEAMRARDGQRHRRTGDTARLVEGARPSVLRRAAQAPTQTPEALGLLARSPRFELRRAVARNAATPVEALGRLAADRRWEVRSEVARNAATPAAVRAWLADDRVATVRRAARRRLAAAVRAGGLPAAG